MLKEKKKAGQVLGLKIMLGIMIVLAIIDLGTALSTGALFQYAETNPLFVFTSSITVLVLVTVVWLGTFYYLYTKLGVSSRFCLCSLFVWHCVMRVYGIKSNLAGREIVQAAEAKGAVAVQQLINQSASVSATVKTSHYFTLVLAFVLPIVLTIVSFLIFKIDHEVNKK